MSQVWHYNNEGECIFSNFSKLSQPVVHMLANSPQYFSICDNFLRGYSGYDYTRMFGEFDGPNFPKGNARFLWFRFNKNQTWLANNFSKPLDNTEKHSFTMGLGYVTFTNISKKLGIEVKATVYVPLNEMKEIWLVEVRNISKKKIKFDFIPAVPIFGGSRAYTEYHRDVVRLYNKSRVTGHIEIVPGLEWVEGSTDASDICYYMAGETSKGRKGDRFYSDRETFLGSTNSWAFPESIIKNKPPKFQCLGKEVVGAIEFKNVSLKSKETIAFVISNGISHGIEETEKAVKETNYKYALESLKKIKDFWNERSKKIEIETGNKIFDLLWNRWWGYQLSMRYWFGNTGHPQFDYGSDFSGWRDFWQDMMAATVIDPQGLEKRALHTLEGIRLDGTNATRFFARTKEFGSDEINGLWCDHPYWTTQTVLLLINFLGDPDLIFKEGISYFKDCYRDRGEKKDLNWPSGRIERQKTKTGEIYKGTVLEHLLVQLLTMFYDVGQNNLLKQKRADWNDAVDQVKGENVTFSLGLAQDCVELADFLENIQKKNKIEKIQVFEELIPLIDAWPDASVENIAVDIKQQKLDEFLKKVSSEISGLKSAVELSKIIADLRNKSKVVIETVNKKAFNGEYYIGYFHADGSPVDSIFKVGATKKKNPTTDDFVMMLMPQTWALLSKAADEINATNTVLDSVWQNLFDDNVRALKLNYPAYNKFNKKIGRITGFAAGTKENNAIFCHANLFMCWALLKRRKTEEAFKIFSGINPLNHNQEILRTGPWIPEYYISSDNPNFPGRGEYPMLTASGGWARYLIQNFFFGVRGELDGLRIDPCLPAVKEFKECKLSIHFRNAFYEIYFKNQNLIKNAQIQKIIVDGTEIKGNLIKPFSEGNHSIEVFLG
ncbi:MAG: hypothetical protein NT145_03850 [Elusimicrobia bacterium]|nr:hypothetical protein [Elusimicrobiota bacterium]